MSSLDQDDADKRLQRAVPWVSDPQHREQRDSETRRLQEDVIEAAKRLERDSANFAPQPPAKPRTAVGLRLPEARQREDRVDSEERAQKIWAQLKPEFISPPPQDGWGLSGLTLAAGALGAMAVSAVVALVVVNVLHFSTINADGIGDERPAKGNSFAAAALGDLAKVSEAQAKMTHADEPAVPAETLLASVAPNDVAPPKSPSAIGVQTARVEPDRPEVAMPAAPAVAATSAAPPPRPATPLPPDEVASLLKRGQDLIAAGDIASARLVLTLVAEAGNAEACFTLAGTFDPAVLANLRTIGVQGDPVKARGWYARAAELGSLEARRHLQALR
jgi:hypothetical protein